MGKSSAEKKARRAARKRSSESGPSVLRYLGDGSWPEGGTEPRSTLLNGQPLPPGERTIPMLYADWQKYHDPKDRALLDEYEEFMGKP
jgi:hypothetical protein